MHGGVIRGRECGEIAEFFVLCSYPSSLDCSYCMEALQAGWHSFNAPQPIQQGPYKVLNVFKMCNLTPLHILNTFKIV
jgi:hypothetical protein